MGDVNPLKFDGRIGRLQFLVYGAGITFLLGTLWFGLVLFLLPRDPWLVMSLLLGLVTATVLATSSYGARRLQDLGQPGWLYWLGLIPGVSLPLFAILLLVPGTPGPNRYGTRGATGAVQSRAGAALKAAPRVVSAPAPLVSGRVAAPFIPEPEGESGEEHYRHAPSTAPAPAAVGRTRASSRPAPPDDATSRDVCLGVFVDPASGRETEGGRVHLFRRAPNGGSGAGERWTTVCGMPVDDPRMGGRVRLVATHGEPTCVSCLARM